VLTYTAWEVYVEDLLLEAVPYFRLHTHLPQKLRDKIAQRVQSKPWNLAEKSWTTEVEKTVKSISVGEGGRLGMNSANTKNVNEALEIVFGDTLLDRCRWQGMSATANKKYIDQLFSRRGALVHRGALDRGDGPMKLGTVRDWADWVGKLADKLDALAANALQSLTGQSPW
jgi:hypothetical protein